MIALLRAPGRVLALFLCLLSLTPPPRARASSSAQLTSNEHQQLQREARLILDLLQNHHYSGRAFREIENHEMVTRFLMELDPRGDFLTIDDAKFVHRRFDRTLKSVYLFRGDLQPAFEIFDLYSERVQTRLAWVARRMTREFDLTAEESYQTPRKPSATTPSQFTDESWERHLKNGVLREMLAGRSMDDAVTEVARRYAEFGRRVTAMDSFAIRERFFDAIIRSFDPHSGYFSADSTREFAVDMENAVSGLGLDLRKEDGQCIVSAVQPGGPADLHSTLGPGDTLLALADDDGSWVDASSRRLREIVTLLRGEPGRPVRLAYRPEGTTARVEVTLERARVVLPADRARGAISEVPDPTGRIRRIGWIVLPSFYAGGEKATVTSAARDMRELLDQMAGGKIDGLVLDLRLNPGGALPEAVAISQLFLPGGCMMLSRGTTGKLTEHNLKAGSPAYTGPLVVLTSAQSASASEILAGALKFHRRALVVGGETTFGKGTAQNYIQMAKLPGIGADLARDWGTLRLTTDRFYLPDGRAIQRVGVTSHVVLPEFDHPDFEREAGLPHALPEESVTPPSVPKIPEAAPAALPDSLLQFLRERAARNFQELPEWNLWHMEQQYQRAQFGRETHSLQLAARQREWAETLAQFQAAQRLRRPLTESTAFPTQPLEIASVQAAFAAHETRLRSLDQTAGTSVLHHLRRGGFFIESDRGRLREIRLADIGVTAFYGDGETLAAAFAKATGHPLAAADARRILEAIALLKPKTDGALFTAVQKITGGQLPEPKVSAGIDAFLQRLTELDNEMHRERPGLDIPLREGQRLAAAWARWLEETPAP